MKKINLLTQNAKMKKSSIKTFNFGITALYSERYSMKTCPSAKECAVNCYARQGTYTWTPVKNAYENRLGITLQDNFSELMIDEIKRKKAQVIRIHDSGDFYSREYLQKWLKVMDNLPNVKFYTYTKSYSLFEAENLPDNFIVIYSQGSSENMPINKRHARVFLTEDALNEAGYVNATNDDTIAWQSDNINIGLIYHGNKKPTLNKFINL